MKRIFDILCAVVILLIFLPVGIPLIIALRFTGEGEIFFMHPRVGRGGKTFGLLKFATMLKNSPSLGTGDITLKNDPRIMPLGPFLRKTKINEVPQILNILKGDMSIIGPRPLTPKNFGFYSAEVREIITSVQPGLSGIGSIVFRDEESILAASQKPYLECYREEIAPYKGRLEVWYTKNRSFYIDLKLFFLTAWVVVFPGSTLFKKCLPGLPERV
jgi:lipopolysaccharide/colanic/teichoic acid biosynthesis glycosyltransferase